MEAPPPGTTLYLDGVPLDRIEPVSSEDQGMIEESILNMARRRRRAFIHAGMVSIALVITFVSLGALAYLQGKVLLF